MPPPRCFFSITINGVPSGRIVFELFYDDSPKTCENFRHLCTGEKGEGKTTFKPLHYKGTPIHRIVKGFIIQGGDFSNGDGTGGESIYGGMFEDENLKLKHDRPFLLSMANKGPDTNGSQFFITTRPAPHLDGLHVVFGHVIQGKQYVAEIENQKVDANHRPYADVRIANCGELVLLKAGKIVKTKHHRVEVSSSSSSSEDSSEESTSEDESESGSSSSEEEKKRRRKQRKKRKATKKMKSEKRGKKRRMKKAKKNAKQKKREGSASSSQSSTEAEEAPAMEEVVTSTFVTEEDLPPEIGSTTRSWLYRYSKSPSPSEEKEERRKQLPGTVFKRRDNQMSNSGRKLKGRGPMRYRTPPRYGDSTNWRYQSDRRGRWGNSSPARSRSRSRDRRLRRQRTPSPCQRSRSVSPSARRHRPGESVQRYTQRRGVEPMSREQFPSRSRSTERCGYDSGDKDRGLHSTDRKHGRESPDRDEIRRRDKYAHSSSSVNRSRSKYKQPSSERPQRRSPQRKHEQYSSSHQKASSPFGSNVLPSKWARHHDSDSDSTSDEDRELEMAYQRAQRSENPSHKDIFGIAELSQECFNN